jgi:hypothetical protein
MVKEMFEHHARSGTSLSELVDWAAKRGLTTRSDGRLRLSVLHQLLQNPIYYGTFRWAGEEYEGKHEPLITRGLFGRCQERLKARTHSVTKRSFPYRGLVVCGYCGCQLTAAYAKQGRYSYYRCTEGRGRCEQKYIREDRLGTRLAEVVDRVHLASANVSDLMQLLEGRRGNVVKHRVTRLAHLEAQARGARGATGKGIHGQG